MERCHISAGSRVECSAPELTLSDDFWPTEHPTSKPAPGSGCWARLKKRNERAAGQMRKSVEGGSETEPRGPTKLKKIP